MKMMPGILGLVLWSLSACLSVSPACAEPLQLSLPAAINMALSSHPDLLLARNRRDAAAVAVEAARGSFQPSLEGTASTVERIAQQPPPGDSNDYRTLDLGLSSRLNLFNGFADVAGLGSSRQQLSAAESDLLRQQQTIAFDTSTRFIAVITADQLVTIAEESLAREQALLEQIDAFYKAGSRSVTDLYQQQAATAQSEFELLDARRNLKVAELQLLQALGQEPPLRVEPLTPAPFALISTLQGLSLDKSYSRALALRPDLRAQRRRIAAAGEQVRQARAGGLPSVDLFADLGTDYTSLNSGRSFGEQLKSDNGSAALGISLSVPIFDRSLTRTGVGQAQIGESDARAGLARLRQQIGVEVGQALADYRKAELQLKVVASQLTYATQALAAAEARYKAGAATWIDLAAARTTFVQAEGDEVRARQAMLQQGLAVGYARGDLENLLTKLHSEEPKS